MDAAFEGWLTSFTADFPARICLLLGSEKASTAPNPASGSSTSASFAKFNPDGSLSKTSQACLWEMQDEPYLENLPASGSMRSGSLYERPTWAPRTSGNGCSSSRETWRTPAAGNPAKGGSQSPAKRLAGGHTLDLQDQAEYWATPQAHDTAAGNPSRVGRYGTKHGGRNLTDDVMMWMTPNVPNGGRSLSEHVTLARGKDENGIKRQVELGNQVKFWPTPPGRDWKSGEASEETAGKNSRPLNEAALRWPTPDANEASYSNGKFGMNLREKAATWPTPTAKDDGKSPEAHLAMKQRMGQRDGSNANRTAITSLAVIVQTFPSSLPAPATSMPGAASSPNAPTSRRRLNPAFVDWLMGFPENWSSTNPSAPGAYEAWVTQCVRHVARLLS